MTLRIRRVEQTRTLEAAGVATAAAPAGDDWSARLAKLIPAEALGLYGAAVALVPTSAAQVAPHSRTIILWCIALVCLVFSAAIRWKATSAGGQKPQVVGIAISLVSFLVWLMALGAPTSPIALPPGYGFLGGLIALVWGTIVPYFYRGDP